MKRLVLGLGYESWEHTSVQRNWREFGLEIHLAGTLDEAVRALQDRDYIFVAVHMRSAGAMQAITDMVRAIRPLPIMVISPEHIVRNKMQQIGMDYQQFILSPGMIWQTWNNSPDIAGYRPGLDDMGGEEPLTIIIERDLYFCLEHRAVKVREQDIILTPMEFDALYLLLANRKRVLTFETISVRVWGDEYIDNSPKAINNLISRLRGKLKIAPDVPNFIKNIHGIGYKFESP